MKTFLKLLPIGSLTLMIALLVACESSEKNAPSAAVYGTAFYDPWLYGDVVYHDDVVITPPDGGRPGSIQPHPEHPIASPPSGSVGARPTQMPSIPSAPRVAPRGGRR